MVFFPPFWCPIIDHFVSLLLTRKKLHFLSITFIQNPKCPSKFLITFFYRFKIQNARPHQEDQRPRPGPVSMGEQRIKPSQHRMFTSSFSSFGHLITERITLNTKEFHQFTSKELPKKSYRMFTSS